MTSSVGRRAYVAFSLAVAAAVASPALAAEGRDLQGFADGGPDLSDLSLEELAQVEITSVSRRPEPVSQAAAAIFVITAEDIRRSGATSLPEVLRLAPNLQVQRMNAGEYAVSARGFNGFESSNKLLVLVDGRSIYSSLHSGVLWDFQTTFMLQDIERIEVISGPGGALWGANAVNGVINIITRSARDTQGSLASVTVGDEDSAFAFRHGGALGETGGWRAYVSGTARDDLFNPAGGDATDAIWGLRSGFRADWTWGRSDLSVQGSLWEHDSAEDDDYTGNPIDLSGAHLLAEWSTPWAQGNLGVQAYYDHNRRSGIGVEETVRTADLHVQYARLLGERHQVVVGAGYRAVESELTAPAGSLAFLDPERETIRLANVFAQDQIDLGRGLTLTVGLKLEDNSFTGSEILPNVRLAWRRDGGDLVWAAVSRAARTPNRIERGLVLVGVVEPGDFQSEVLTAYELGYRATPSPNLSFSINAFLHQYDELRTTEAVPVTFLPVSFGNLGEGTAWGVEAWGAWQVNPGWRLSAGVHTLEKDFETEPGSLDISGLGSTGDDPDYQILLRSQTDITDRLELDASLRAVGELAEVDSYVDADVRLGWDVNDQVELSLVGRDLFSDRRRETGDPARSRAFGRSFHVTLTARF